MKPLLKILVVAFWALCPPCGLAAQTIEPTNVADLSGKSWEIPLPTKKATVMVFLSTTWPICNRYAPELARLAKDYAEKSAAILLIQIEDDLAAAEAEKHAKDFALKSPVVLDPGRRLAKLTGAGATPEAVVVSPAGKVLYRGAIDDRFPALGKDSVTARHRWLRQALDEILANQPVAKPVTPAIGCAIE